jgi:gamma-glutamylcyclotransferase (GGCT)/AIG2-like uncharacterized protein YtfP
MSHVPPLFAYGTLQFGTILERLLGRTPSLTPAMMTGGTAMRLPGVTFPGLVLGGEGQVSGVLLRDLTPSEFDVLEEYEDEFYDLVEVVVVTDRGESVHSVAFVVDATITSEEIWTREWFEEFHLEDFREGLDS